MSRHALGCAFRSIVLGAAFSVVHGGLDAAAQTVGTFTWQAAPYCNVMTLTVTADGAGFRLSGFDDQCGTETRAPAAGIATQNPDGTYALGFYVVTASGLASHTRATLNPATFSGPWIDNAGFGGDLVFDPPPPVSERPRPMPLLSSLALAPDAVDSIRIADGSVKAIDLADASVSGAKLMLPLARTASSADSLFAITNAGSGAALFGGNSGAGPAARFVVSSTANTQPGLDVAYDGLGAGVNVVIGGSDNASPGIAVYHGGSFGTAVSAITEAGYGVRGAVSSALGAAIRGDNDSGDGVTGNSSGPEDFSAVVGRSHGEAAGVRGVNSSTGIGVIGQTSLSATGIAGMFDNLNNRNDSPTLVAHNNGLGDLIQATHGLKNVVFRVTWSGIVTADIGFTGGGADVAEFIDATTPLMAGDVVEIDASAPGSFRLASTPSSTRVAGVITTRPGLLMNASEDRDELSEGPALALAGRVPVKVCADNGAIVPGDLLVASSVPGHAMKAPADPAPGTVIGKALGAHARGRGTIEMLVMLR